MTTKARNTVSTELKSTVSILRRAGLSAREIKGILDAAQEQVSLRYLYVLCR